MDRGEVSMRRVATLLLLVQILLSAIAVSDVSIYQGTPVQIIINSYPSKIVVGTSFSVTGSLVYATNASGVPDESVFMEISTDGGSTWATVASGTTNRNGAFTITYVISSYVDTLYIRLYHPANVTSRTGEYYSEVITVPVSLRTISGGISALQPIVARLKYDVSFSVSDVTNEPLDYTGSIPVYVTLSGTDMIIRTQYGTLSQYDGVFYFTAGVTRASGKAIVEFVTAGEKTITLSWSSPAYEQGSTSTTVNVQKQTPILAYAYANRRADGTYLILQFLEVDNDVAPGLPLTSVKVNGVEVLSNTVYTNVNGFVTIPIPSNIAQQGVPVVITTADTDAYAGSTYQTTLDLRLPTKISISASITSAGEPATLTIQVIDIVNGNYVSNGAVSIKVYDQGQSYSTSVEITQPGPITVTVPASVVLADPGSNTELGVYVTYSGSDTYQPSSASAYFDVPTKPAYITLLYNDADASQTIYCYNQEYEFKAVVKDSSGNSLSNVYVYAVHKFGIEDRIIASGKTNSNGEAYLKFSISELGGFTVRLYIKDPNGIYYGKATYTLQSILCGVQSGDVLRVNVYESYTITKSGLGSYIGKTAILYNSNSKWEKLEQLDSQEITSSTISFTRMETEPSTYYYLIDVVDNNDNSIVSFTYTVIAKYKLSMVVTYPKTVYAGEVVNFNVLLYKWDQNKWLPYTNVAVNVYETGYHYVTSYYNYEIYGYWDYIGMRQVGTVNVISPTENKFSFFAYRYAGVYGAPPITMKFEVPETDNNWKLVNYYTIAVQPISIDGSTEVTTTTADGTPYNAKFGLYSACYDFLRVQLGTYINVAVNIQANSSLQLILPVAIYYTDFSAPLLKPYPRIMLASMSNVYVSQNSVLKFVLPPLHYTDGTTTPYGPIHVRMLGTDMVPPFDIIQFYNVLVEPNPSIKSTIVAGVADPTIYKKGSNIPLPILGIVIGSDGTPLYNEQLSIKLISGSTIVASNTVYSDFNGVFSSLLTLEKVPSGKYTLEITAPSKPYIAPFRANVIVLDSGGLIVIAITPYYVFKNMGYGTTVLIYEGDPVPVEGFQVKVWYSNIVYTATDRLTWTYLGTYTTDYTGSVAPNIPDSATELDPGKDFGWMYVLVLPASTTVDPNKAYTSQSQVEQLLNAGKTYVLASPEALSKLEQMQTGSSSSSRLGGEASTLVSPQLAGSIATSLIAGFILYKLLRRYKMTRYVTLAILLSLVTMSGLVPFIVQASFTGISDMCIGVKVVGGSPSSVTIDVTPIMEQIHLSPFVRSVIIYGAFPESTVTASGEASEITYQVVNNTIVLGSRDLDRLTGLREPLHITLSPAQNITRVCIDYFSIAVKVINAGRPVPLAQIGLMPSDQSHSPVYSVSNNRGDAVLNYLPNKSYELSISVGTTILKLNLTLTSEDDDKLLTVDISSRRISLGNETYQAVVSERTTTTIAGAITTTKQQQISPDLVAILAIVVIFVVSVVFVLKYKKPKK